MSFGRCDLLVFRYVVLRRVISMCTAIRVNALLLLIEFDITTSNTNTTRTSPKTIEESLHNI